MQSLEVAKTYSKKYLHVFAKLFQDFAPNFKGTLCSFSCYLTGKFRLTYLLILLIWILKIVWIWPYGYKRMAKELYQITTVLVESQNDNFKEAGSNWGHLFICANFIDYFPLFLNFGEIDNFCNQDHWFRSSAKRVRYKIFVLFFRRATHEIRIWWRLRSVQTKLLHDSRGQKGQQLSRVVCQGLQILPNLENYAAFTWP